MKNLYEKFTSIKGKTNIQFRLEDIKCPVMAYYGITGEGCFRVAFLSKHDSNISGSTENIVVYAGPTSNNEFWTCFDLKNPSLLQSFCILAEDLVSSIDNEPNEMFALQKIKNRFHSWVKLLKRASNHISKEEMMGLYGELYCLRYVIGPRLGYDKAILGWGGPNNLSKDFSIDKTWYEIKTTGVASSVVKISSIQQLESDVDGHLIVLKVEEMSEAYKDDDTSINKLCQSIISELSDDSLKDDFLLRLSEKGNSLFDEACNQIFSVHSVIMYLVNSDFPSLKLTNLQEETIRNAKYELMLDKINDFVEEKIK